MTRVTGGCHGGAVRFEADLDLGATITCNCSYCTKRGSILTFVPAGRFRATAGGDRLTTYRFHRHRIDHRFCPICCVQAFASTGGADGQATAGATSAASTGSS